MTLWRKVMAAVLLGVFAAGGMQARETARRDSIDTAVGTVLARGVRQSMDQLAMLGIDIDRVRVLEVMRSLLVDRATGEMTPQEASQYIDNVLSQARPGSTDTVSVASQQQFVDSMAARDGAILTPEGLVFMVIQEGEGAMPTIKDRVRVNYKGALSDGTVFDNTNGEPIVFDVGGVVPGFAQGLMMMRPSGTYRIIIPASLGYGTDGIPGVIPGNSALDFTVTLEEVIEP